MLRSLYAFAAGPVFASAAGQSSGGPSSPTSFGGRAFASGRSGGPTGGGAAPFAGPQAMAMNESKEMSAIRIY
jgi:hypothetical protein